MKQAKPQTCTNAQDKGKCSGNVIRSPLTVGNTKNRIINFTEGMILFNTNFIFQTFIQLFLEMLISIKEVCDVLTIRRNVNNVFGN